jgi:phytoene synthase
MKGFLQYQVGRAKKYYDEAERGLSSISTETRLALSLCFSFYKAILGEIEKRDYDVFTKRVIVPHERKMELLQKEMAYNPLPKPLSLQ